MSTTDEDKKSKIDEVMSFGSPSETKLDAVEEVKTVNSEIKNSETENKSKKINSTGQPWRILIVDDEEEVHKMTDVILDGYTFNGEDIELYHAYSGEDAKKMFETGKEFAVVLLDVVMESDDAGLLLVNYIREDLKDYFVRILLRTGQPGAAPERETIENFDIDGYLPKAEVSSNRFYSAFRCALKSHRELMTIEVQKNAIKKDKLILASLVFFIFFMVSIQVYILYTTPLGLE
jgi:CheY-like chemotaxis protein